MISFMINIVMIVSSASSLSDKKDNSYLRINHLLIFFLQILKFLFLFSFMILFVIYAEMCNATTLNLIELFIIEYLLIFFVATKDNLRYIYFKLLELLHMKDWPYDKRYSISSKLYCTKFDFETVEINFKTSWLKNIIAVITILLIIFFGFFIV